MIRWLLETESCQIGAQTLLEGGEKYTILKQDTWSAAAKNSQLLSHLRPTQTKPEPPPAYCAQPRRCTRPLEDHTGMISAEHCDDRIRY